MALPSTSSSLESAQGGLPLVRDFGLNTLKASNLAGFLVDTSGNVTAPGTFAVAGTSTFTGQVTISGAVVDNTEVVTATNVITASESGKTFYLNALAGFLSTLPAPSAGLTFRFIVQTAPTSVGYTIATTSSSNIIKGMMVERAGGAGVAASAGDLITLVANQSIAGDWFEVYSDGTSWFIHGMVDVSAGVTIAST